MFEKYKDDRLPVYLLASFSSLVMVMSLLYVSKSNLDFVRSDLNITTSRLTASVEGGNIDSDNDGMDDGWENTHFGSLSAEPNNDADNDLLSNIEEYRNGTNPKVNSNISQGKSYTFSDPPSYAGSIDSGDATQLTDGIFALDAGNVWVRTVAWSFPYNKNSTDVVLDLGAKHPITALKYSTFERRNLIFPQSVWVEVSEDGTNYSQVGDLVKENDNSVSVPPHTEDFTGYTFYLENINAYGRYVRFHFTAGGGTVLIDELMVFEGGSGSPGGQEPPSQSPGEPSTPPSPPASVEVSYARQNLLLLSNSIKDKANQVGANISAEISAINNRIQGFNLTPEEIANFSSVFPKERDVGSVGYQQLGDLQRDLISLNAKVWQKQGITGANMWRNNTWDDFNIIDGPASSNRSRSFDIKLMNNERTGDVFMISNANMEDKTYDISIEGLPSGDSWMKVFMVQTLETDILGLYSDMLVPISRGSSGYRVKVPSGMTVQIWLEFNPVGMPTGIHSGKIILNEGGNQVADLPLSVSISSFTFPNSFSMGLSTWEYLSGWNKNDNIFNANYFRNHDKLVEIANHYKIDWPFSATTAFSIDIFKLEAKHFDSSGKFIVPTGYYDNFDSWVRKFPNAKKFIISMGLDPALTSHKIFAGANYESQPEIFKARLTGWVDAVESHIVNVLNMQPSQFALFPSDELQIEGDKLVITWIKPLIERPLLYGSRIQIYVDPARNDPNTSPVFDGKTLYDYLDIIGPAYNTTLIFDSQYRNFNFLSGQRNKGKQLSLYTGFGMNNNYYPSLLLSGWIGYKNNITSMFYYRLTNIAERTLNFYKSGRSPHYSTLFFEGDNIYSSKRFEAVNRGRGDYEYLRILGSLKKYITDKVSGRSDLIQSIESQVQDSLNRVTQSLIVSPRAELTRYSASKMVAWEERNKLWDLIDRISKELNIIDDSLLPLPLAPIVPPSTPPGLTPNPTPTPTGAPLPPGVGPTPTPPLSPVSNPPVSPLPFNPNLPSIPRPIIRPTNPYMPTGTSKPNPEDYRTIELPNTIIDNSLPNPPSWIEIFLELVRDTYRTVKNGVQKTVDGVKGLVGAE